MFKAIKIIGLISISVYLGILFFGSTKVRGLNGKSIKKVKPGMTIEEVIRILGRPLKVSALQGLHDNTCRQQNSMLDQEVSLRTNIRSLIDKKFSDTTYCCEGNKEDLLHIEFTFEYTRPDVLALKYPMLWVHFDSSYTVYGVYAKQYDKLDDREIYSYYWPIDTTTLMMRRGTPNRFINKKLFADCFPD